MKVLVLSEEVFSDEKILPLFSGDAIISIKSPFCVHPRPKLDIPLPRLDINFHDITEDIFIGNTLWRTIQPEHAKLIVDFVEMVQHNDRLIIHCEAGISRSPGVAIGLARFFDIGNENELRDQFPHFNIIVAHRIWRECEERGMPCRFPT